MKLLLIWKNEIQCINLHGQSKTNLTMKKIYSLITASFFLFTITSFSQALTRTMPDTVVVGAVSADIECLNGDTLYNTTPNNLDIDVVRTQDVTMGTWQTAFCLDVCYLPSKDSGRMTMNPMEHQGLVVHFYTDATPTSDYCIFKFKNVNTPSNMYYQKFYATSQLAFGIHEASANTANVNIYPSPVVSGNVFTMQVSNAKTGKEISIIVYDIYGNAVNKTTVYNGINFMSLDLPAGIYSYSLISGGEKINSGKIAVSK